MTSCLIPPCSLQLWRTVCVEVGGGRQRAELRGVCHRQWALCLAGCDSAGVDQVALLNSRFLASLLLLCFSLLSTFFAFIRQPGPSCEMGFSAPTVPSLMDCWLIGSNQRMWTLSHKHVVERESTVLAVHSCMEYNHKGTRVMMTSERVAHPCLYTLILTFLL